MTFFDSSGRDLFRFAIMRPPDFGVIRNVLEVDPHVALEELRAADPDGHALLTEHIVFPERGA